ncbi:MAG TPA: STAS domain-containing protein [Solirubrobacteraceae bacterium]|nr:STAS domain-containing protein [Solirubrobacteraceae bacterium]
MIEFDDNPGVLICVGDEARCTQGSRRGALIRALRADMDVVVDLTQLVFADASLMADLAMVSRRLRRRGRALRLRGAQPQIMAIIESFGLHRLPGVRIDGPSPALA